MKHHFPNRFGFRPPNLIMLLVFGLMLLMSASAFAALGPAIVYQTAPGKDFQLYYPNTQASMTLAGTSTMKNVVIGDVDGDGAEDEMVYVNSLNNRMGYYKIPADGLWHSERNFIIPYAASDAIPLTVLRLGGLGTKGYIVYTSPYYHRSYCTSTNGLVRYTSVWMDKAYAADVRQTGIKSDLVWWANGVGMRWRAGFTGYDYKAPRADWVLVGCGKLDSTTPGRVMAFYNANDPDPVVCFTDRYWGVTRIDNAHWSWTVNKGSSAIGEVDTDGVAEFVTCVGPIYPLQWYNVPPKGGVFDFYSLVTVNNVFPSWNIAGVARVTLPAVTPPLPPPTPTPVSVSKIAGLATQADGTLVQLAAKSRTKLVKELSSTGAISQTGYYLEETDSSAGVRVVGQTNTTEGQQIAVTGTLATLNGERVIKATNQTVSTTTMKVPAIASTIKSVLSSTAMTGLLVTVTGTIASADIASGTFSFSDGLQAIKVYDADNNKTSGQFTLTGCIGAEKNSAGAVVPVIRVESSSDLSPIVPVPPVVNAGYSVWTATALEKVFKADPVKTLTTPVIKAAKNEHEAFQVVLRGGTNSVNSVAITATDLTSGASKIPAANVSIFQQSYIYLPDYKKDYPDALPPYTGPFTLAAGETKPIWLDVYVPKGSAGGDYTGKITITDASGAKTEVPYVLHVYDFELPDTNKFQTAFQFDPYEMATQHRIDRMSTAGMDLEKIYNEYMVSHGVCPFVIPTGVDLYSAEGANCLTDPRLSAALIPWTTNPTYQAMNINRFDSLGVLYKGYFYLADEIWSMTHVANVKRDANYVHGFNPKALAMATVVDDPRADTEPAWVGGKAYNVGDVVYHGDEGPYYWQNYLYKCVAAHTSSSTNEPVVGADRSKYWSQIKIIDELKGYTNLWCIGVKFWETRVADALEARRQAGDTLWGCTALDPKFFIQTDPMALRALTWQAYHYACTGFLYWKVDFWSLCPNPWTSAETAGAGQSYGRYGEGSLFYPGYQVGINGPVTSLRMETLRDSIEDYKYFLLLEQKIGRDAAKAYTDQVANLWNSYKGDKSNLASIRDQIAQRIEAP